MNNDDSLITQTTLKQIAGGISDMTVRRWSKEGVIPKPIKIRKRNYWRRQEVLDALNKAAS